MAPKDQVYRILEEFFQSIENLFYTKTFVIDHVYFRLYMLYKELNQLLDSLNLDEKIEAIETCFNEYNKIPDIISRIMEKSDISEDQTEKIPLLEQTSAIQQIAKKEEEIFFHKIRRVKRQKQSKNRSNKKK